MDRTIKPEKDKTAEVKIGNTTYIVSSSKATLSKQDVKSKIERLIKNAAVRKN